jgi:protein-disulfide isomerase
MVKSYEKVIAAVCVLAFSFSFTQTSHAATPKPRPSVTSISAKLKVVPKGTTAPDYGIVFNFAGNEHIDIWEDFQCANCAKFESTNKDFLDKIIRDGKIKVTYHVLSFLGADSVILANAAGCAADEGKFAVARDQFFALQSATKNSGVWTNSYLLQKLADVGISSARFVKCIKSNKYLAWVSAVENTSTNNKIMAAPTILIDGREINRTTDYFNSAAFQAVVENPASIVAPTPKPTPSAYKLNFSVSKIYGVEPVIGKPSGPAPTTLGIGDLIVGTGNQIQSAQTVTVQYVLMEWTSGQVLESSWKSAPFTSSLANVIPGWQQGLIGMKVGGRRILIIPPDLAYGATGSGSVGPNQTLVFVIDLLAVGK